MVVIQSTTLTGSPPHTWRIPLDMTISNAANRITSTYVENTIFPSVTMAVFQDHLHIRGEYKNDGKTI